MNDSTRMWLLTSNDRKLIQRVLHSAEFGPEELTLPAEGHFGASIFAAGGDVLSVRRPLPAGARVDELIDQRLRSYRLVANWEASDDAFRSERVQPFRHKGWVFSVCGDAPPAEQACTEDFEQRFVERYVRGDTSRELLMGRVLARLHRADPRSLKPDAELIKAAIVGAVESIVGPGFESFSIALTTDDWGAVYNHGRNVHVAAVKRLRRTDEESAYKFSDPGAAPGSHLRAQVIYDGPTPAQGTWTAVPSGSLVVVDELPPAAII